MIPRCWFLRFSVQDGAVLVGLDYMFESVTLLGSSCGTSLDVGVVSERPFKIFPNAEGSDLILVRLRSTTDVELGLIHITHEKGGKIVVSHDPMKAQNHVHLSVDYQQHKRAFLELLLKRNNHPTSYVDLPTDSKGGTNVTERIDEIIAKITAGKLRLVSDQGHAQLWVVEKRSNTAS